MNFKRKLKKTSTFLLFLFLMIVIGLFVLLMDDVKVAQINISISSSIVPKNNVEYARVTRVIDGDTIEIEGGMKVRYLGIDTTEIYPKIECYSHESAEENKKLVEGKNIILVKDASETDKYGRLLRYVYVDNLLVNGYLVENGYAKVETVLPDVKYRDLFFGLEMDAKQKGLGLWSVCKS